MRTESLVFDAHVDIASAFNDTVDAVVVVRATVLSPIILDVFNSFSTVVGSGVGVRSHRTNPSSSAESVTRTNPFFTVNAATAAAAASAAASFAFCASSSFFNRIFSSCSSTMGKKMSMDDVAMYVVNELLRICVKSAATDAINFGPNINVETRLDTSRVNARLKTFFPSASASSYDIFLSCRAFALASHAFFIARLRLANTSLLPEFKKSTSILDARSLRSFPSAIARSSASCIIVEMEARDAKDVSEDDDASSAMASPSISINSSSTGTSRASANSSSLDASALSMNRITGDISKFSLSVPAARPITVVTTSGSSGDAPLRHAKKRQIRNLFVKCVACAPTGPGVSHANINAAAYWMTLCEYAAFMSGARSG